nr:hypothetical protein [Moorella thermoacetica]
MVVPELFQQGPQLPLSFHPENWQAGPGAAVRAGLPARHLASGQSESQGFAVTAPVEAPSRQNRDRASNSSGRSSTHWPRSRTRGTFPRHLNPARR